MIHGVMKINESKEVSTSSFNFTYANSVVLYTEENKLIYKRYVPNVNEAKEVSTSSILRTLTVSYCTQKRTDLSINGMFQT